MTRPLHIGSVSQAQLSNADLFNSPTVLNSYTPETDVNLDGQTTVLDFQAVNNAMNGPENCAPLL